MANARVELVSISGIVKHLSSQVLPFILLPYALTHCLFQPGKITYLFAIVVAISITVSQLCVLSYRSCIDYAAYAEVNLEASISSFYYSSSGLMLHHGPLGIVSFCFIFFFLALIKREQHRLRKNFLPWCGFIAWCCVFLLAAREKFYVALIVAIIIQILVRNKSNSAKNIIYFVIFLSVILGTPKLIEYFNLSGPRANLIMAAEVIANTYFPVGSGFGTFGTLINEVYPSAMIEAKLYLHHGLTPENPVYIYDNYLATLLGQTGYIGAIIFALLVTTTMAFIRENRLLTIFLSSLMFASLISPIIVNMNYLSIIIFTVSYISSQTTYTNKMVSRRYHK